MKPFSVALLHLLFMFVSIVLLVSSPTILMQQYRFLLTTNVLTPAFPIEEQLGLTKSIINGLWSSDVSYFADAKIELHFDTAQANHMQDVQRLFFLSRWVWIFLLIFELSLIFYPPPIKKDLFYQVLIGLGIVSIISIIFWQQFFVFFHLIFFPGGNWAFPADSTLILLFPNLFWQLQTGLLIIIFLSSVVFQRILKSKVFKS